MCTLANIIFTLKQIHPRNGRDMLMNFKAEQGSLKIFYASLGLLFFIHSLLVLTCLKDTSEKSVMGRHFFYKMDITSLA